MRSRVVAGPCPGLDCCRAGARKCRTRSGDGAEHTHPSRRRFEMPPRLAAPAAGRRVRAEEQRCHWSPTTSRHFAALDRHETRRAGADASASSCSAWSPRSRCCARARAPHGAGGAAGRDQRAARGARPRQRAAAFRAAGHRGVAGRRRRAGNHRRRLDRDPHAAAAPRARLRHPGSSPTRRRRSRARSTALRQRRQGLLARR